MRSALPMDPRSAFQPNGSALVPATITPEAPAASAPRITAPRLPGSCISQATTTSGVGLSNGDRLGDGRDPSATIGLLDRTGLAASITLDDALATSTWELA